ncbi:cysteine synthase /cystathionine gamma-synthase [Geothermobacter ehrlichii]|uniref:Cysteine synthase /cystathionine gamma-synthase n=1 Tax=Geothermobacter ehrlichii TaxID=213224 RepID=A0A5D3WMH2_9BACT|nr:PLP-dependent aspartate aminotransferase family protein [Geothermobacter ehrlichii]TYO98538.1 cysteine synthase /cystathionine gamma-synthase [Geothermobacter ehrlichii]
MSERWSHASRLVQTGTGRDDKTGAISFPIHPSATYRHPGVGQSTGFDYTRSGNPTRQILEEALADLEGGARGLAFASGMAALTTLFLHFSSGDHLILSEDLYGGTYRVLDQIFARFGLQASFVDTTDCDKVAAAITGQTRALLVETPGNPLLGIADLEALGRLCRRHDLLFIVDNTFLTPLLQRPFDWGADIVVHSATKYLGGHSDLCAGALIARDPDLGEELYFLQNSTGSILPPQDCWLLMRSLKTLPVRMERHCVSADRLARWLNEQPQIRQVYYPGLPDHPGHELMKRQATAFGGMLSFRVDTPQRARRVLERLRLISFAESLGGVESLITMPAVQTHGDIPEEERLRLGIDETLLRLSVGLEAVEDLIADLERALAD